MSGWPETVQAVTSVLGDVEGLELADVVMARLIREFDARLRRLEPPQPPQLTLF